MIQEVDTLDRRGYILIPQSQCIRMCMGGLRMQSMSLDLNSPLSSPCFSLASSRPLASPFLPAKQINGQGEGSLFFACVFNLA